MSEPDVIVVIPYFVRRDLLVEAMAAVEGLELLVVDDSVEGVHLDAPVLRLEGGGGFARAANAGLAEAERRGIDRVLLLNDDAAPEPGCVEAHNEDFEAHSGHNWGQAVQMLPTPLAQTDIL